MSRRLLLPLAALLLFAGANLTNAQTVTDLNKQIQQKQQRVTELNKQIETYQKAIAQKQAESSSLRKQLGILDDKISKAELGIQAKDLQLSTVTLQIQSVTLDIANKDRNIADGKVRVAELLRQIHLQDQRSLVEIAVLNNSLGEFFEQVNYLEALQQNLQSSINEVQTIKTELQHRQEDLASFRAQLVKAKEELEGARQSLSVEQETKQNLLQQTKQSEAKFQTLVAQLQQEQSSANRDIQSLESEVRRKLQLQGSRGLDQLGDAVLMWPVSPTRGISTYFYDPTYPFRRYFEHPGIDIPKPQGSAIKAAADGYVARAKNAGFGYSYIMLVHKGGISTVYGHVSRIDVTEDTYVTKGQVIGAVGGMPGTPGAGKLTTGPHLHLEVRSNGLPVNPLDYLP